MEEPLNQVENESESTANVIDGPDIQALSIDNTQLELIREKLVEANRNIQSQSNQRSKKVMVRKEQLDFIDQKQKQHFLGNSL